MIDPTFSHPSIFNREFRLFGEELMLHIFQKRVILFGVGGVGSWCAESLVRSGIEHLTIVDPDTVNVTNINRQLLATTKTIGRPKVEVLKERLLEINPHARIHALQEIYQKSNCDSFQLESYDYIIDAIDSLENKAHLLLQAAETQARVFSSMGAALKLDPIKIQTAEFWKVKGCPLARALREKFKKMQIRPKKKIVCVFSDEVLPNKGEVFAGDSSPAAFHKVTYNGSIAHATALFGFMMAGLVMQDIHNEFVHNH